jgi:hypothetical protein
MLSDNPPPNFCPSISVRSIDSFFKFKVEKVHALTTHDGEPLLEVATKQQIILQGSFFLIIIFRLINFDLIYFSITLLIAFGTFHELYVFPSIRAYLCVRIGGFGPFPLSPYVIVL